MDIFMLFLPTYHNVVSAEDSHLFHCDFGKSWIQIYKDRKYELFLRTKKYITYTLV